MVEVERRGQAEAAWPQHPEGRATKRAQNAIGRSGRRLAEVVEGEGGAGDGSEGQGQEGAFVVVAGDAVGADGGAAGAAMDDGPFPAAADLDGDGLHGLGAGAAAVAGRFVEVA